MACGVPDMYVHCARYVEHTRYHTSVIRLTLAGLGNRSIFYPGSSVGSAITFGIVEDTSANPTSNISFKELLARASYCQHVSLGPQDLDRSLGRHVRPYTETRQPIRPKDPAVPRGGECYKAYPGWAG